MGIIIIEITVIVLIVAFLIFLARDDRNNRKIRAEEDRQALLAEQKKAVSVDAEKSD